MNCIGHAEEQVRCSRGVTPELQIMGFSVADFQERPPLNDHEKIQGVWRLISGERHGKAFSDDVTKRVKLEFSKDILTTISGEHSTRATFKLDAEKSPKEIDIDMDGEKGVGIYALDGDG